MILAEALRLVQNRLADIADHPSFEAELLLSTALHTDRGRLFARLRDPIDESTRLTLERLVEERRSGAPLSLLRGWKQFRNLTLFVSRGVFIPRYETETLVDAALEWVRTGTALDLGTGSGALALALASEGAFSAVFATDISEDALALASRNALYNNISGVSFFCGDLYSALPAGAHRFNLIVSNPPYIPSRDLPNLPPSILNYEPLLALNGGEDGLDVIRRILISAPNYLAPGGAVVVEIAPFQVEATTALFRQSGFSEVRVFPDATGQDRCIRAIYSGDERER